MIIIKVKIRTRLTFLFTFIIAGILLVFAAIIYFSAKQNRENEFYSSLKKEAITKANLFFNAKVNATTLQTIYKNNRKVLNEVEVAIYDTSSHLLYHDVADIDFIKETRQIIDNIIKKKEIKFYRTDWQVIGILYYFDNRDYVITAESYDQYGYSKLSSLRRSIFVVFLVSLLLIFLAAGLFIKKIFAPLIEMTSKAKTISATNLDLRLKTNNSKHELSQLANTFNEMLNRLENSFDAQKNFVANISHELRTPLSAMITELELSQFKERSIADYKTVIRHSLSDAKKLARLSNSLLDFAKASYDPSEINFSITRLDELLLDAQLQVQKANPEYDIDILFEKEFDNDDLISVNGNAYLLKTAFVNLMENACKFSQNKQCTVSISYENENVILKFADKGSGIEEEDLPHIFTAFYRGKNKEFADGNGIGLSLTQKIVTLHKGKISVQSKMNEGTIFELELPHL